MNLVKKIVSGTVITALVLGNALVAIAAPIISLSDNMSSLAASEIGVTHVIGFTLPTAGGAGDFINITFPAGFDVSGATVGASTPAVTLDSVTGQVVRVLVTGAQSGGQAYSITLDDIDNPAGTGAQIINITAENGDTGEITVFIVSDDQVLVTAQVNQTINFAVSDNSIGFGTLVTANDRYATGDTLGQNTEPTNAHTLTAGTNATSGYSISAVGNTLNANGGADTIDRILDAAAPTPGTEQFGFDLDYASGGSAPTIAAPFDAYGMTDVAATPELIASNTVPTADNIYDVNYVANIAAVTDAGAYSTTMTYTMTANF